jgi:hypothetical protein
MSWNVLGAKMLVCYPSSVFYSLIGFYHFGLMDIYFTH